MSQVAESRRACALSATSLAVLAALAVLIGGCTTLSEYVHNGFKVGPKFHRPAAPVAEDWIDAADPRVIHAPINDAAWWSVFNDATLDSLIDTAHRQNLTLKIAALRVFQSRAERNITAGNLLPQSQNDIGAYAQCELSKNLDFLSGGGQGLGQNGISGFPNVLNVWTAGYNASWELDFWGRLRRILESSNAELGASTEAYRDALVTLLADVAVSYVQIRTFQQRIAYARRNVELQQGALGIAEERLKGGRGTGLDVAQAKSNLAQTEASIPPLEIGLRQASNRLCVLLGVPPHALVKCLGEAQIPAAPPEVAAGVPAELLERRPDVRQARKLAAAQCARIGVAEADFLPRISFFGFFGDAASDFRHLFDESSFTGILLPNFQWKALNYGRVLNGVRSQDALFRQRVLEYQQTVLTAGREVEDALVSFLQSQARARSLEASVRAGERSVQLVLDQYREGRTDFNRVFTTQSQLVTQQDQWAAVRGDIAQSLIAVYRALGGGWRFFEHAAPPSSTKEPEDANRGDEPKGSPAEAGEIPLMPRKAEPKRSNAPAED